MPDLGAYAVEVTLAYAGSILLLVVLLWVSVAQSRRAKRTLDEAEDRTKDA
jgi:heme exporter protein D